MTRLLDADQYDESQTVTIKVPLSVPYMYNDVDFKRAEGTFEYEGEFYRLVKQKYQDDTLTIICIRDTEHKRISEALSSYVSSFGDDNQDVKLTISFIKEYLPETIDILTSSNGWQRDVVASTSATNLIDTFSASVVHPPERA
ncbi:MAG TPA: hypothetical protein VFE50_18330 [Cyclobacteriaceae bacterium]|nr:hypothetical protein [Cyclobacteriaceae bacterium]